MKRSETSDNFCHCLSPIHINQIVNIFDVIFAPSCDSRATGFADPHEHCGENAVAVHTTATQALLALPFVLSSGVGLGLPLEIAHRVRTTNTERLNVVFDVAGTRAGRLAGRWTGMLTLKLLCDSTRARM